MEPDLKFSRAEFAGRLAATRAAMAARGFEVIVVSDPSNLNWLTGYDGWSFYVHQALVVPPEGEPVWFGRAMDAEGAYRTAWLSRDSIVGYADDYVQSTEKHPMQALARLIAGLGYGAARIGVEMDNYWYTAAAHAALVEGLPGARFGDATGLVNWQRAVKSPAEIGYMREAARIVEAMHARIVEVIEPGMRKCDLVAEIYDASLRGVDGIGGDYPAIVPMLPSGADAAAPHLTWDDRPMRAGEGTFFEIAGCRHRYHAPLSRTVFLGKPTKAFLDAEGAVLEGMEAGLAAARPGNTCEDIAIAFFDTLAKYGFEKDSRTGYSIGASYPPDWGERTMSLRRGDRTELRPGMCFHFMTGLWLRDMGLEITESILVTETGVECLANVPRKLVVKGVRPSPIVPSVDFEAKGAQHGHLRLPHSRDDSAWGSVMIPVTVVAGAPGPTALLTGGNHGDEYEGPLALFDLARALDPETLTGRVIIVPALNYPAFRAGTRTSPIDRGNLNRMFPGRPDGTVTEKIADFVTRELLPRADIVLDFHSGGRTLDFLPFAAAHVLADKAQEARAMAAVAAFGAPFSTRMVEIDDVGMLDTTAEAMGKVFVTTELGGGGTARAETVAIARAGVANLLRHAGILPGAVEARPTRWPDMPEGCFSFAPRDGLVETTVDLGARVAKGEVIARIHAIDRTGAAPEDIRARIGGMLVGRHFPGLIQMGDCAAVVAVEV